MVGAHPAGPRHAEVLPAFAPAAAPGDLGALPARIWPMTTSRGADGSITIGGVDVRDIAREFGTPVLVLDETDLRTRARSYREAYAAAGARIVYYAAKAFLATAVARWVHEEGLGIDVATGGELTIALRAGIPGDRLLMHGNNKSKAEIEQAVLARVGRIVVDSLDEIDRIADIAAAVDVVQDVLIRVTVGVEAHTHEFIATAHEDQKFGLSLANGDVDEAVRRVVARPSLRLAGLHSHIGSQIFDASGFEVAAARVVQLTRRILDEHGIEIAELNLGGGMGIAYIDTDDPLDVADMAAQIGDIVGKQCAAEGIPMPALAFEPGRAIVGPAGVTVYEVGTVKPVTLDHGAARTYVSVDGGMSDNIRTALYGADYSVALASRPAATDPMLVRVVGKHCESGDIVVRDGWLPADTCAGDLIAVPATGAYCRSMASNYNYLPRPAVIAVRDGQTQVVLRRETLDDVLRLDPGAQQ